MGRKKKKKRSSIPSGISAKRLFETRDERLTRQLAQCFDQINEITRNRRLGFWERDEIEYIQQLCDDGWRDDALQEAQELLADLKESAPFAQSRPASSRRTSTKSMPTRPAPSPKQEARQKKPQPVEQVAPAEQIGPSESTPAHDGGATDLPLPEVNANTTPLTFVSTFGDELLGRLLRGDHDPLGSLRLARQGIELLAEEGFDRLLALDDIRGINHYAHQLETVLRVLKRFRGRVLLADEVGLGKTIESCIILKEYMLRGQVRRALVLVPPALVGQWTAELREKFGIDAVTTRDSLCRQDPQTFWQSGGVIVASLGTARAKSHATLLKKQYFDLIMVDEAHHIKNRTTKGWQLVNELRSRFFLLLTATPVETNLTELYNLVTLLRPGTLGTAAEFRSRFVDSDDPAQPRDAEQLRTLLKEVMVRNTRAVSGIVLPPRSARTIIVKPTQEERQFYELLLTETRRLAGQHRALFRLLLEEAGSSPAAVAATAAGSKQRRKDAALDRALGAIEAAALTIARTEKLDRLAELVGGDKVLIFSRFRATMDHIAANLAGRGVAFVPFHGGMNAEDKDRAVTVFEQEGIDVMLCSEIGGEGRNLQFCHRLINFDLPWNPMQIEQRIGRIHRIGQTETVEVINLACAETVEERILDVLDRRINLFELVVGEMDMVLGELSDEREFEDRVFDIVAQSADSQAVDAGFESLAEKLIEARGKLDKTKALDEALFGTEYEA
jgi:superfamily II DNA or RNA helicase